MKFMTKEDTVLAVIDLQEKLMPVMSNSAEVEERASRLIRGMKEFGIPVLVTQQYTKGIGETTPHIAEALGDFTHIEKMSFSAMLMDEFREKLEATGRKNVVLCGIEAHICVLQTALQLMDEGYGVYLAVDCISSRDENDRLWGITRMGEAGAIITTYESVLYEILQDSRAPEFKAISRIVK